MRWREGPYSIERCVFTGKYLVKNADRSLAFERPSDWGLAQTRADCRAIIDAGEQERREAEQRARLHRQREAERLEAERIYLRRVPHTECRKCGTPFVDAFTEGGQRLPLDTEPTTDGHWVVIAQLVHGRSPVIVRATTEPTADRYEIHHATCRRRLPLVDSGGQLNLAIGRWVQLADQRPRRRRTKRPAKQLSLTAHAEQLEIIC